MIASKNNLIKDVSFLTSIFPYRNYKNVGSLNRAAEYIKNEFYHAGLLPSFQTWVAQEKVYRNVIASYQPEKRKTLVLGAHYDVYGDQPGADDNASGVAGLLETARLMMNSKPLPDYRIDFVAYSLEEPPFFGKKEMGSYIHARTLFDRKTPVIGMLSYEMIGRYSGHRPQEIDFPEGIELDLPMSDHFVGVISIKKYEEFHRRIFELMAGEDESRFGFVSFPNHSRGPSLSDNRNYWHFGYPAVMLNSGPSSGRNPHYHQKTDTPDTLNFDVMAEVVTAIAGAVAKY